MRNTVLLACVLLASASSAYGTPGVIAGGPIFGSGAQTDVVGYVFNAGDTDVTVTPTMIDQFGTVVVPNSGNCQNPVQPNGTCYVEGLVINTIGYACTVKVSPAKQAKNVRGSIELRANHIQVVANSPLR